MPMPMPMNTDNASRPDPRPEPTLDAMLADPIVQALMKRDGVSAAQVRRLMMRTLLARSRNKTELARAA